MAGAFKSTLAILILLGPLAASAAPATDVPQVLNFSGRLATDAGDFTGSVYVTITLYDDATATEAGHVLWVDTLDVFVDAGRFHVLLGADPSNPIATALLAATEVHVGVQMGDSPEMMPRLRVASVPFAIAAGDAMKLGGKGPADYAAASHAHALSAMTGQVAENQLPASAVLEAELTATLASYLKAGQVGQNDLKDWGCSDLDVVKWDDISGQWKCGPDQDTTYAAGTGLKLTGGAFELDQAVVTGYAKAACYDTPEELNAVLDSRYILAPSPCTSGQYLRRTASGWECATLTLTSGTVTSITAGTGLSGGTITTSGTIAIDNLGVVSGMIADGAVGSTKIAAGAVGSSHIAGTTRFVSVQNAAGTEQFAVTKNVPALKVSGSGGTTVGFDSANSLVTISSTTQSHSHNASDITAGTLAVGVGGTGSSTAGATGGVAYSDGAKYVFTAAGPAGTVLHGGASPAFNAVKLEADVTGVLPVANGGTGSATQSFVDLSSNQMIGGRKIFAPSTDVAGVIVRGSSATSPTAPIFDVQAAGGATSYLTVGATGTVSWKGTASGSITGSAGEFTSALAGDVSGTMYSTSVTALRGKPISPTAPSVVGQVLRWDGAGWAPGTLSVANEVTGVLAAVNGGTGIATPATGALLVGGNASALQTIGPVAAGSVLISNGVGVAPKWGKVDMAAAVTGVLPVANGGTGASTAAGALANLGAVGGTGTANVVAKWGPGGTALTDSGIAEDANSLTFKVKSTGGTGTAQRALLLSSDAAGTSNNVVGGGAANWISAGAVGAFIGGGGTNQWANTVTENYGVVTGGYLNLVGDVSDPLKKQYGFVGGGYVNIARGEAAAIAGGSQNQAVGDYSFVGGGASNTASGAHAVAAGGTMNQAQAQYAAVCGGSMNRVYDGEGFVGGGSGNTAGAEDGDATTNKHATVGGGTMNAASAKSSTVAGGEFCVASAWAASAGGGYQSRATGNAAVVAGGQWGLASADSAVVGGGNTNSASGLASTVGGGFQDTASGDYSSIAGGKNNSAAGLSSTIGGGDGNNVSIANGYGQYGTISGGKGNKASHNYGVVAGGLNNDNKGFFGTILGGEGNTIGASADRSVVGGSGNQANAYYNTIPGGYGAVANSFGQMAYANGFFASGGDAQVSTYVLRGKTATATATELFLDGASARIAPAGNVAMAIRVLVTAGEESPAGSPDMAAYQYAGIFYKNGASCGLYPSTGVAVPIYESVATMDFTVSLTGCALSFKATGVATKTMRWVARVETSEAGW
jgi:hypothetical protein